MPRVAKIWQRAEDGWWYCTHRGKKVKLSQDRKEAQSAFHELRGDSRRQARRNNLKTGYRPLERPSVPAF